MIPTTFPEANTRFGPPPDIDDSQCGTLTGFAGQIQQGSLEGAPIIVTAWKPSEEELAALHNGAPVFIGFITGGLPPHVVAVDFKSVAEPA